MPLQSQLMMKMMQRTDFHPSWAILGDKAYVGRLEHNPGLRPLYIQKYNDHSKQINKKLSKICVVGTFIFKIGLTLLVEQFFRRLEHYGRWLEDFFTGTIHTLMKTSI